MRIIFIPGFGEEPWIFDRLHPLISGEKVFVDHWRMAEIKINEEFTPLAYASAVIRHYKIKKQDLIIGHSMGGWIALHIKQLLHCPVIQIASWTDENKVVKVVPKKSLLFGIVKRGLAFNPVIHKFLLWKDYRDKPSAAVFSSVFSRLCGGDRACVVNQLRLVYAPAPAELDVNPDLRIHAKADPIIHFPDQPVHQVPGDHFTLWTHPEEVYKPISAFLENYSA